MKRDYHDAPMTMTPDERRTAIAKILAAGVLRLQARPALEIPQDTPTERQNSDETRPLLS